MKKSKLKNLEEAMNIFFTQKSISEDEIKQYVEEIFIKAFSRDGIEDIKDIHTDKYDGVEILDANIDASFNVKTGKTKINKIREVARVIAPENLLKQISIHDPLVREKGLKEGEMLKEEIDLTDLSFGKVQNIKQLLIQRTRESEKTKLYDKFADKKGELLAAKLYRIEEKYAILDFKGVSIFMPRSEMIFSDSLSIGKPINIYVLDIDKISKDAQIIASRIHPDFVVKLIEKENYDVMDKIVKIEKIVREPGIKSKILVSSEIENIDPVGSIVGIKGSKIRPVIDELNGERIDVIQNTDNLRELITKALLPGKAEGIVFNDEETPTVATIIVEKENFLPSIGKRGINIRLAAKLVGMKLDVKTVEDAKNEDIKWKKLETFDFKTNNAKTKNYSFKALDFKVKSVDELIEIGEKIQEDDIDGEDGK